MALRQAGAGTVVTETCVDQGVCQAMFYRKKVYGSKVCQSSGSYGRGATRTGASSS